MLILGIALLAIGCLLCLTFFFLPLGLAFLAAGIAVLIVRAFYVQRQRFLEREYRSPPPTVAPLPPSSPEDRERARISLSQFGR